MVLPSASFLVQLREERSGRGTGRLGLALLAAVICPLAADCAGPRPLCSPRGTSSSLLSRTIPCSSETGVIWDGRSCIGTTGCGATGRWRMYSNRNDCYRDHASCPLMDHFACGSQWCDRGSLCVVSSSGTRRCMGNQIASQTCAGLKPFASDCSDDGRGNLTVTLRGYFSCGPPCARFFERCDVTPTDTLPHMTCQTLNPKESCPPPGCHSDGAGATYRFLDRVDVERSPTFYCGPAHKCRRHREVCLYPRGTTVFDRPGRCVEQPFHGCGGMEAGECIDDGSGGHYLIR